MKRKGTALLLLVGSIISGVSAIYIAEEYINAKLESNKVMSHDQFSIVKVVVAKIDMTKQDVITYENLAVRDMPIKYVHENVIHPDSVQDIIGNKLIHDLKKGEPLLFSFIHDEVNKDISHLIKAGERAITIQVDSVSSMSGLLRPGNKVDLMLTLEAKDRTTRSVIKNATVLATGDSIEERDNVGSNNYNTITLAVTPLNASRITLARSLGTLSVVLRPDNENNVINEDKDVVSAYTLFNRKNNNKKSVDIIVGGH